MLLFMFEILFNIFFLFCILATLFCYEISTIFQAEWNEQNFFFVIFTFFSSSWWQMKMRLTLKQFQINFLEFSSTKGIFFVSRYSTCPLNYLKNCFLIVTNWNLLTKKLRQISLFWVFPIFKIKFVMFILNKKLSHLSYRYTLIWGFEPINLHRLAKIFFKLILILIEHVVQQLFI